MIQKVTTLFLVALFSLAPAWTWTSDEPLPGIDRAPAPHALLPTEAGTETGFSVQRAVFDTGTQNGGAILQDRDGFIWVGTAGGGLMRFDGYELKIYKPGGINPFPDAHAHAIYEDRDGLIWIMTQSSGLVCYDKDTDTFESYTHDPHDPTSISSNVSTVLFSAGALAEDAEGLLWVGTQAGLNAFDKRTGTFTRYLHEEANPNSPSHNNVYAVLVDRQERIWIGTDGGGLDCLDKASGTFTHFVSRPADERGLASNVVHALLEDQDGVLWVGTDKGLHRFNAADGGFTRYPHDPANPNSPNSDVILSLRQGSRGLIWITYMLGGEGGVSALDPRSGVFRHYLSDPANPYSPSTNSIDVVWQDRAGIVWLVNDVGVVDKLDPNASRFVNYPVKQFPQPFVSYLYEDSRQTLWISTFPAGLTAYDKLSASFTQYFADWHYSAVCEDSEGNVWLGYTWPAGLALFDRQTGKIVKTFVNDPADPTSMSAHNNQIGTIVEDKFDPTVLWLGTYGAGVEQFDKKTGTFKHYPHDSNNPNSVVNDNMWSLYQDRQGMLWLPTVAGLDRFDPRTGIYIHYPHDPNDPTSLSSDSTYCVLEDSAGRLWVGTALGFDMLDRESGRFTHYTQATGYPVTSIISFVEDDNGYLWMGSYGGDGLISFDPRAKTMRVFRASDGLPGDTFTRAAVKDHDGKLWFGGTDGLTSFYPGEVGVNEVVPPVHLTALKQGGEPMSLGQAPERVRSISLDWRHNYFEFEYAALNFTSPTKNQYRYMLEGLDKDWYDAGTRRFGRYSGLDGGAYTLRVIGSNNDGVWNEEGVSLQVVVVPPWWARTWFRVLAGLVVVGVLLGIYLVRVNQLKTAQALRESQLQAAAAEAQARATQAQLDAAAAQAQAAAAEARQAEAVAAAQAEKAAALQVLNDEVRRAWQAADQANQAKSDFLASTSHELRTPLNGILGYAQILLRGKDLTPLQHDGLSVIQQSGQHLLTLINDILDLSKIEAGKLELYPAALSLPDLLQGVASLVRVQAQNKGLDFVLDEVSPLPPLVHADGKRLRQVLINLLNNAIKFTHAGSVMLRAGLVGNGVGTQPEPARRDDAAESRPPGSLVRFEVIDTGVGIAADQLDKIFQPFEQAGDVRARAEGAGLGLSIARRLVELMGSRLHVHSQPGRGSTFCFDLRLPAAPAGAPLEGARVTAREVIGYAGRSVTVLVVDDLAHNRAVMLNMLEPLGFEVSEAGTGQEALDVAVSAHPDVVVMDMIMPGMTGFEAVQQMRQMPQFKSTFILGCSASVFEQDRQKVLAAGCDAFLPKPIELDRLLALLQEHLGLDWIYAEGAQGEAETAPAGAAQVTPPPPEELRALLELAQRRSIARLCRRAEELAEADPRYRPFVTRLRELARTFDSQAIAAFIEPYLRGRV
ncbi:MAG: response regulator [Thermoflexales bacterium]|nr:response regulator [Thermoflexales bacterium]